MQLENETLEIFHGILRVATVGKFDDLIANELPPNEKQNVELYQARLARIVAAVNAFEGIPTESIPTAADIGTIKWKWWMQDAARLDNKISHVHFRDCQCDQCTSMVNSTPKCRDCADFGPICPNSGKPCSGKKER